MTRTLFLLNTLSIAFNDTKMSPLKNSKQSGENKNKFRFAFCTSFPQILNDCVFGSILLCETIIWDVCSVLCPCLLVCVSCLFGCVFLFGLVFVAVCFQGKFCLIRFQSSSIPVVDRQCLVLVRQCRKKSNLSTSTNSVSERVVVLRFLLACPNLNYVSCDASDNTTAREIRKIK